MDVVNVNDIWMDRREGAVEMVEMIIKCRLRYSSGTGGCGNNETKTIQIY